MGPVTSGDGPQRWLFDSPGPVYPGPGTGAWRVRRAWARNSAFVYADRLTSGPADTQMGGSGFGEGLHALRFRAGLGGTSRDDQ